MFTHVVNMKAVAVFSYQHHFVLLNTKHFPHGFPCLIALVVWALLFIFHCSNTKSQVLLRCSQKLHLHKKLMSWNSEFNPLKILFPFPSTWYLTWTVKALSNCILSSFCYVCASVMLCEFCPVCDNNPVLLLTVILPSTPALPSPCMMQPIWRCTTSASLLCPSWLTASWSSTSLSTIS